MGSYGSAPKPKTNWKFHKKLFLSLKSLSSNGVSVKTKKNAMGEYILKLIIT